MLGRSAARRNMTPQGAAHLLLVVKTNRYDRRPCQGVLFRQYDSARKTWALSRVVFRGDGFQISATPSLSGLGRKTPADDRQRLHS